MNDDIPALRRQLAQLNARHAEGTLSAQDFAAEKASIERALLERVLAEPATPAAASVPTATRPSARLVALLAVIVLAVAGAGYWWTGSPAVAIAGAGVAAPGATPEDAEQAENVRKFSEAVEQLRAKLEQQPNNGEGWALLARSYVRLGQLEPALAAFKKAVALRGDDAALLVDYADVLAVANNRSLQGEPSALIARALAIDPDQLKALSLAGAAAFDRHDYKAAAQYWERVVSLSPPGSAYLPELQSGIDEARKLGGLPARTGTAATAATAAALPASDATRTASAAPSNGALRGTVRLAPELAAKAAPTDTVFVYARAADGPRMPLAILRLQVKDLPAAFTLDDSLAMSPAAKLSGAARVIVSARVSKSGQAMPSAGDLLGESAPMANHGDGIALLIDRVVTP